jgi:hypothetical protein
LNTGRRGGKPGTNRLSYGAASLHRMVYNYLLRTKVKFDQQLADCISDQKTSSK